MFRLLLFLFVSLASAFFMLMSSAKGLSFADKNNINFSKKQAVVARYGSVKKSSYNYSYDGRLNLQGIYSSHTPVGAGVDLLLPITFGDNDLLFSDFHFLKNNNNKLGFNVGLGYRHLSNNDLTVGSYGFFDHKNVGAGHSFNQLTFGAELSGSRVFFGANTYIPFLDSSYQRQLSSATDKDRYNVYENIVAMPGVDMKLGYIWPKNTGVTTSLGGYYYFSDVASAVIGPKASFKVNLLPLFGINNGPLRALELINQFKYDAVNGVNWLSGASISFNLHSHDLTNLTPAALAMTAVVDRDYDIYTQAVIHRVPVELGAAGHGFSNLSMANAAATTSAAEVAQQSAQPIIQPAVNEAEKVPHAGLGPVGDVAAEISIGGEDVNPMLKPAAADAVYSKEPQGGLGSVGAVTPEILIIG